MLHSIREKMTKEQVVERLNNDRTAALKNLTIFENDHGHLSNGAQQAIKNAIYAQLDFSTSALELINGAKS